MGLSISADVFQREMTKLFDGLDFVMVYIDNILMVTKGNYEDHLSKLRTVLKKMLDKGMQLEAKKTFSAPPRSNTWGISSCAKA